MKKEKGKIVIRITKTETDISAIQKIKAPLDMTIFGAITLVNAIVRKATQSGMSYNEARNKVLAVIKDALKQTKE